MFGVADLKVKATETHTQPYSDGHLIYSALLDKLDDELAQEIHDDYGSVHLSGLEGYFEGVENAPEKRVFSDNLYSIRLGVSEPNGEGTQFKTIMNDLLFEDIELEVGDGKFFVDSVKTDVFSFEEVLQEARGIQEPVVNIDFYKPTSIRFKDSDANEMFPHRFAVFTSLQNKWNQVVPDEYQYSLTEDVIGEWFIERPDPHSYDTYSVVVKKIDDGDVRRPIKQHAFTAKCEYRLRKDAPAAIKNAFISLSRASEATGVGTAVSRGLGAVNVNITDDS